LVTLQQEATVAWAQERASYLHLVQGLPIKKARFQAANEAAELAREEFGASSLAASSIEQRAKSRDF
jgi:hypothetical protein